MAFSADLLAPWGRQDRLVLLAVRRGFRGHPAQLAPMARRELLAPKALQVLRVLSAQQGLKAHQGLLVSALPAYRVRRVL